MLCLARQGCLEPQPDKRDPGVKQKQRFEFSALPHLLAVSGWAGNRACCQRFSSVSCERWSPAKRPFWITATGRGRSCLGTLRIAAEAGRLQVSLGRIRCTDISTAVASRLVHHLSLARHFKRLATPHIGTEAL